MCKYNYVYHSACQHGELTRLTSCPDATALGLSNIDNLSPDSAGASYSPGDPTRPSAFHPPATSANNSSSSSSHNQPHHHNNMSTLRPSEAGHPCTQKDAAIDLSQQASDIAFTPRSVLNDGMVVEDASTLPGASPNGNFNIEFPLYSQATLSMEIVRDEALTSVGDEDKRTPGSVTRRLSGSDAGTIRGRLEEPQSPHTDSHTIGYPSQTLHSPRKSLPSHWLPKSSGPNLATAQRAKERSHKKDSQSGFPIQSRTVRGARSSNDLSKPHGVESPTYLTKEALDAVENDVSSPTSTDGPNKLRRSPSKPSWRSTTASPLRSSPSQHMSINMKISPTRASLLNVGSASGVHSRAASSVAASCRTFHTANESPVRSPSGTELSFQSAPEHPDHNDIPHLKLDTDYEVQQPDRHHDSASPIKHTKPRLALQIPIAGSLGDSDTDVSPVRTAGGSNTHPSSSSPELPRLASRIPRVAGTIKSGSAYSATRSSTLKRNQSIRSLATKSSIQQIHFDEPHQIALPETPAAPSLRHVRTVNSSGTTPILSRHSVEDSARPSYNLVKLQGGYHSPDIDTSEQLSRLALGPIRVTSASLQESGKLPDCSSTEPGSQATSTTTVKASPLLRDPVPIDSAIIYSRKKGGDFSMTIGTASSPPMLKPPTTIAMTAQTTDLIVGVGNLNKRNGVETFEFAAPLVVSSTASSVRGRTDGYVPELRLQTGSQHSLQSTGSSELRATAPNFVPRPTPDGPAQSASNESPENISTDSSAPLQFQQAPWFPLDMSDFDQHGIPWFYYMYPVQFAYDQGFRNGRTKSPRKFKPKKQRQSFSSPVDAQHSMPDLVSPPSKSIPAVPSPANMDRRSASRELMPPPPVPAHRQQHGSNENILRGGNGSISTRSESSRNNQMQDAGLPFGRQLDVIAQQDVLCNNTNIDRPHGPSMDITTVYKVNAYQESRNTPSTNYYTVSMRNGRYHHRYTGNGLYNGRGSGGVPMHATTPFPDPSPPQGRPPMGAGGSPAIIGTEACGHVDVLFAAELGGGWPCNTCAPDH